MNKADSYVTELMLNALEEELYSRKKETRSTFKSYCHKFFNIVGVKDTYEREDFINFFENLEKKKYSGNSIRCSFYALKALFRANEMSWPMGKNVPRVEETFPEIWEKEKIESLIQAVREKGDSIQQFLLSLSTTYGLRRGEMARMKKEDIDPEKGEIAIKTEKMGEWRKHIVPDEIKSYLAIDSRKIPSSSSVNVEFWRMCQLAGIKRKTRENFHIIRASLVTELIEAGVPEITVDKFMRWKRGGMVRRYHRPKMEAVDEAIFEAHPYLIYWR